MNPSPGTWLVAEARSWDEPGCNTTTCGVHAAHSNHIKPLNLVDQSQEASGAGLAVSRVRWVTLRDNLLHSAECRASVAGRGPRKPLHRGVADRPKGLLGRPQASTRRAFGMERSM